MSILIGCTKCGQFNSRKNTACSKCGAALAKSNRFKINVPKPEGGRVTRTVGGSLTLAKKVEAKLKGDIAQKKHLGIIKAPLLSEVWEQFHEWGKANKKTWQTDLQRWEIHIEPILGNMKMDSIKTNDVQKVLSRMEKSKSHKGKRYSPQTIKHIYTLIKRLYNWASEMDYYSGPNPAARIKGPKVNNQVTRCLADSQLKRLDATLSQWRNKNAALIVKFALHTGLRSGEILGLRWTDIDFERGFVKLGDPKGQPVVLPLSAPALAILDQARDAQSHSGCEWVFPNKWGQRRVNFNKIWNNIKKAAKLPEEFRFHDLRHTFASLLASSGEVDLYVIQKLLNQQTPQMTQRYAHLRDEALRRGADVAAKVLNGHS